MNMCIATATALVAPNSATRVTVVPSSTPANGELDPPRLQQVPANLLDNALMHSPGGESITLVVEASADEVVVSVRDGGAGVPSTELPGPFERSHRATSASATGVPATGRGPFIGERITSAHGGRLWAESARLGIGSAFRLTLPLHHPSRIGMVQSTSHTG